MRITTEKRIVRELGGEEPDYGRLVAKGTVIAPMLLRLEREHLDTDSILAARVAHLAAVIDTPETFEILDLASTSHFSEVRLAVAQGLRDVLGRRADNEDASRSKNLLSSTIERLRQDNDPSVRAALAASLGEVVEAASPGVAEWWSVDAMNVGTVTSKNDTREELGTSSSNADELSTHEGSIGGLEGGQLPHDWTHAAEISPLVLHQASQGNESAFRELVRELSPKLRPTARGLTGADAADEDELLHATFERMIRRAEVFDPTHISVVAWAHELMASAWIDGVLSKHDDRTPSSGGRIAPSFTGRSTERSMTGRSAPDVDSALRSISDIERAIVMLVDYNEVPVGEAAVLLQLNDVSARGSLRSARRQLREAFGLEEVS